MCVEMLPHVILVPITLVHILSITFDQLSETLVGLAIQENLLEKKVFTKSEVGLCDATYILAS